MGLSLEARRLAGLFVSALCLAMATAGVYSFGLSGSFLLDDMPNIVNQSGLHTDALSLQSLRRALHESATSITGRPIAVASFAVDHAVGGLNARQFLRTNVLIHALATLAALFLVAQLARYATEVSALAIVLVTAAWALHPYNLTAVLYVVQRMASLAGLWSFLAVGTYLWLRAQPLRATLTTCVGVLGFALWSALGVLSKENAILIPLLLAVFEWTVGQARSPLRSRAQRVTYWACVGFPALAVLAAFSLRIPGFLDSYDGRAFSPAERLMTQARALWMYAGQILIPRISSMTLYHDGFVISHSLFQPLSTLAALAGLFSAVLLSIWQRANLPWLSFGVLFFLTAHLLESSLPPLELVFEHRNYLPSLGLVSGIGFQLAESSSRTSISVRRSLALGAIALVASLATLTAMRAHTWGDPSTMLALSLRTHPESPRVQEQAGDVRMLQCLAASDLTSRHRLCRAAADHYSNAAKLDPDNAGSLIEALQARQIAELPVKAGELHRIEQRLRSGASVWINYNVLHEALATDVETLQLPAIWLDNWAQAALSNPRAHRRARIAVLNGYAQLLFNRMGDSDAALKAMREAVKLGHDRIDVQLNLVRLLIANGDAKAAAAQLANVRQHPSAWAYHHALEQLDAEAHTSRSPPIGPATIE